MLRRAIFIVSLFVLLSGVPATRADDTHAWTAWLHYGRHMTLVNSAGESLREVDLALPEGYDSFNFGSNSTVSISRSGHLAAYLAEKNLSDKPNVLVVSDLDSNRIITTFTLPPNLLSTTISRYANQQMFNNTDTTLAFGFSYISDSPSDNQSLTYAWKIIILNLADGRELYTLNSDDLIAQDITPRNRHSGCLIWRYDGVAVHFAVSWFDEGEFFHFRTYIWNTATGLIQEDVSYGENADTFIPTNEVIMPIEDFRFPHSEDWNTLHIYYPIIGGRFPFYSGHGFPKFVQNGERILMQSSTPNYATGQTTVDWSLIERDGNLVDYLNSSPNLEVDNNNIQEIPDGFLYTLFTYRPDYMLRTYLPALIAVNTRDDKLDDGQTIWHLSFQEYAKRAGGANVPLEIVWEHDDMPPSAYKPWAQLAAPVYEPTPTAPENLPPPTMIPTPEPLFQVGMTVRVQTTGGEILNLRRDHTRKAEVIMYLENKMVLTLLEGPVESEGFTWWRVRTADGVEGWTVENNGDLQTLMPT